MLLLVVLVVVCLLTLFFSTFLILRSLFLLTGLLKHTVPIRFHHIYSINNNNNSMQLLHSSCTCIQMFQFDRSCCIPLAFPLLLLLRRLGLGLVDSQPRIGGTTIIITTTTTQPRQPQEREVVLRMGPHCMEVRPRQAL